MKIIISLYSIIYGCSYIVCGIYFNVIRSISGGYIIKIIIIVRVIVCNIN